MADLDNPGVDVAEVPTPAEAGLGGSDQPDLAADRTTEPRQPAQEMSLRDRFAAARESAAQKFEDGSSRDEEASDDDVEAEADDEIPAEEAEADADLDESEQPADEGDTPKQTARSKAFREVQAENDRLKSEFATVNERIQKLDTQFKKYGGAEVVESAIEIFEKLATGKTEEVINQLPAHERERVQKSLFETAITDAHNRVFGVNHVLKTDFGLAKDLSPELMEKAFEYLTYRINDDPADFESFIDRELEFASTPERELARLKAENERLKTQPADSPAGNEDEMPDDPAAFVARLNQIYNEFEDSSFEKIAAGELKTFGLDVKPSDPAPIKDAKQIFVNALRSFIGEEMRKAKVFEPLLPFWSKNDPDKIKDNRFFENNVRLYERAMQAKMQSTLKSFSKLLGAQPRRESDQPADKRTPLSSQQSRQSIQPPKKGRPDDPIGVRSAFQQARKAVGT